MSNNREKYIKHYGDNHFNENSLKNYYNNQQQITNNNSNNNNKIINNYNIHLNYDKESFKLMLNEMSNDKFLELIGGNISSRKEFHDREMWDQDKISDMILGNLVNKSIENKVKNESISKIKLNNTDLKYNQIKIQDENRKYITYDINNMATDILKNNIVLTKDEHDVRITDEDYLLRMLFIKELSKNIEFKNGYKYDYDAVLRDFFTYSVNSLDNIKNKDEKIEEDLELKRLKKNILNITKKHFKSFKENLKRTVNNN